MKISKDFEDASMMLSAVVLVLVATSHFSNPSTQYILFGVLGLVFIIMAVLRILGMNKKDETFHYD